MSAEAAPAAESKSADPNVGSAPGMGGTTPEANGSADAAEDVGEQAQENANVEGSEPEAKPEAREDRAPDVDPDIEDARRARDELGDLMRLINADPKKAKTFKSWLTGGEPEEDSLRSIVERGITDQFEESNHKALRGLVTPLLDEIENLRKQVGGLRPAVERTAALAAESEFTKGLERHGLDAATRRDPAFLRILNTERKDPNFQRIERTQPEYAARVLANAYKASAGTASRSAASRRHVEAVKNGNLNGSVPAANGSSSGKVVVVPKGDYSAALAARLANPNARIEYR